MTKKLLKVGTALAAGVSSLYWGVLPAIAAGTSETVNLCPPTGQPQPPGCAGGVAQTVSINSIISSVLNLLLFVSFVIALVFLIIGGIKWMMSGGDKEGSGKAKETVTSALIGLAVVLGAWILINILLNFFGVTGGLSALTSPVLNIGK